VLVENRISRREFIKILARDVACISLGIYAQKLGQNIEQSAVLLDAEVVQKFDDTPNVAERRRLLETRKILYAHIDLGYNWRRLGKLAVVGAVVDFGVGWIRRAEK
jgi:hypothetical protein